MRNRPREDIGPRLSRRHFLGATACLASQSVFRRAYGQSTAPQELLVPEGTPRPRVVRVRSRNVLNDSTIHRTMFGELLEETLTTLTGTGSTTEAWRSVLRPDDIIGLKFNQSAQRALGTTQTVGAVLIESILNAGWDAKQLVCIEAPKELTETYGTKPPRLGYDHKEVEFGSGQDRLASVLQQVTAIVNVPFLKTHNIAGMTCSLKNLSHGFIMHPARYHGNRCSPYVADIAALPEIKDRLRICLVDALRVVYEGGPSATAETISDEGLLLASIDPVACDAMGLLELNDIRHRHGLSSVARSLGSVEYLAAAHRLGVGVAAPYGIDMVSRNLS